MREILFRGAQKVDCTKSLIWYEGSLIIETDGYTGEKEYYIQNENGSFLVIPETVGQYTGLTDKNGKKIFEGDICSFIDFHSSSDIETYCEGIWNFEDGHFYISDRLSCDTLDLICGSVFDGYIIGNIHDSPELLKEADNDKL